MNTHVLHQFLLGFVVLVLSACSGGGGSDPVPPRAPDIPVSVAAAAGDAEMVVEWAPASGATTYNLYWGATSGVSIATGAKVTAVTSPYTITGLTNGTTYYVIVTAENSVGESAGSTEVSAMPGPLPAQVTGVGTAVGNGQLTLSWSPATNATSYNIYWSTSSGVTTTTGTKVTGVSTPFDVTGLTNGTTYYFIVVGENTIGEGEPSSEVSEMPNVIPGQVTGVSAAPGNTQATVSWSAVTNASSYNIYWSTTPGFTTATGTKITGATNPYTLTDLTNDAPYYFIVTAVNSAGEGVASPEVSATPIAPPSAPVNVAVAVGNTQLTISWDSVSGASSYNVYWGVVSGITSTTGTKITNVTSPHVHTSLTNGATYYYVVTAVNVVGESIESVEASGTPSIIGWGPENVFSPYYRPSWAFVNADVALNNSGVGFGIWYFTGSSFDELYGTRFEAGNWGTPTKIGSKVDTPKIVVDESGNATAVWIGWIPDATTPDSEIAREVWSTQYTAATSSWGTPERVSADSSSYADFWSYDPEIAVDGNGNVTACWQQRDVSLEAVQCTRKVSGAWGAPTLVSVAGIKAYSPKLAVDAAGNVTVAWRQSTTATDENIWYSRFTGAWSPPAMVDNAVDDAIVVTSHMVASNGSGDVVIAWKNVASTTTSSIHSQVYTKSTDTWAAAKTLYTTPVAQDVTLHNIVLDSSSRATLVWSVETQSNLLQDVYAARYTFGDVAWTAPTTLDAVDYDIAKEYYSNYIDVDVDGAGVVHVVWLQEDGGSGSHDVWATKYVPLTGWETAAIINMYSVDHIRLDINDAGNGLLTGRNGTIVSGLLYYRIRSHFYNSGN